MKRCLTFAIAICGASAVGSEDYIEPPLDQKDRDHWAYRQIQTDTKGSIDFFVLEKLKAEGIAEFSPPADAATLLRRLNFDLIGLPPTPDEISAFSIKKLEEKIEELLARPQYGEHWAQFWLDLARFAETDGFEFDKIRPDAWKYRDWVISALNHDLPYDDFLAYQIAGDEIAPGSTEIATATGFIFSGPDMPDINIEEERRHNVLNETAATVGATFLGLSVGCAQCHDHKFDPVSQADFYRLRSFFDNVDFPAKGKSLPLVFHEKSSEISAASVLRIRGDFRRTGPKLEPAFLRIAAQETAPLSIEATKSSSGRRLALAEWMKDPKNPLVARVIVNRVWQQHFGAGLVRTPSDFGKQGERPSHPELLDWLAADFVKDGWSLKNLHRKILLSKTWQQASRRQSGDDLWDKRMATDPENKLLSRRNRQRLSGEMIRDAMLQATGKLNLKPGGPGFRPPLPKEVTGTLLKDQWTVTEDKSEHFRRSIYLFARRNLRYPLFEVFDRPDGNQSCDRRHESTTAPQSLLLMNSSFSSECAKNLASLLKSQANLTNQIETAYLQVIGRNPTEEEIRRSSAFIESASLDEFALALFNVNEFVFLD